MKYLIHLIFIGMALICHACEFSHENYGYPSSVSFKKEGGVINITGEQGMTHITLFEDDRAISSSLNEDNDSCWVENSWVIIKWKFMHPGLTIIAKPNIDKKNRSARLHGFYGPEYAIIKVSQKH